MKIKEGFELNPIRIIGALSLLIIWHIASKIINNSTILPSPIAVISAIPDLATFGGKELGGFEEPSYYGAFIVLSRNSLITFARLLSGTLIGIFTGVGLALLTWWNEIIRRFLEPLILTLRNVPPLALLPLFMIWFGGWELGNILFITFSVGLMIVINSITAIRNLSPIQIRLAKTLGASHGQILRTVIIPGIIPELAGGVRVVLGMAWAITLGAEFLAVQSGIGRILLFSLNYLATDRMIIILLIFIIYAYLTFVVFSKFVNYLTRWMPEQE